MVQLSQNFLLAVKTGQPTEVFRAELRRLDFDELARQLPDDAARKAFWMNLYNAFSQVLLNEHLGFYRKNRMGFFAQKWIEIGGKNLSLNDLEHGLLRSSQFTYGFGFLQNPFASAWERRFRLKERDFRIHFALNCGAAACPPTAAYRPEAVEAQLDLAMASFLESDCRYDAATNTVELSRIFQWFNGDFGGKAGIRRVLESQGITPVGSRPHLVFRRYDWSLSLGKFAAPESGGAD